MFRVMSLRRAAAALIVWSALLSATLPIDRAAAREAFQKAREEHARLLRMPESDRTAALCVKVISAYRRVIDHDPTYSGADDSLFYTAELYEDMARRFSNDLYGRRAVYYYEFVAREYPTTKHRAMAEERARLLKSARAAGPKSVPRVRPVGDTNTDETLSRGRAALAIVSSLRYWSTEDYTRIVIHLDREVEVRREVLSAPARLYLDLENCRLRSSDLARTYSVNDLFIKQIRVAENRPGTIRVVLDFEDIATHSMFALYDPFRIIIDIRGQRKGEKVARTEPQKKIQTAEAVIPLDPESKGKKEVRREMPVLPSPSPPGDMSLTRVLGLKVGRVVIDPGHGGKDTGSIGPGGLREKDLVLDVALRLKALLEERLGTEVILTRTGDDFVPLEARTAIANQHGADLFISIHANSSRQRKVSGSETYYLSMAATQEERDVASRENATSQRNIHELENLLRQIALGDYNAESRQLAEVVQTNLSTEIKRHRPNHRNRGVKKAPFIVLIGANMPGILTEIGFLSNASDEKYMRQDRARDIIAESLYSGVEEYFRALGAEPVYEKTASQ